MAGLFDGDHDAFEVLKWKDVVEAVETGDQRGRGGQRRDRVHRRQARLTSAVETAALVVVIARRARLRLRQRVPRRGELDRHGRRHPGAHARARPSCGRRSSTSSPSSSSARRWPTTIAKSRRPERRLVGRDLRRAGRRDLLERADRLSRAAVVVVARAGRRHGRRGGRQGRLSASSIATGCARSASFIVYSPLIGLALGLHPDRRGDVDRPPGPATAARSTGRSAGCSSCRPRRSASATAPTTRRRRWASSSPCSSAPAKVPAPTTDDAAVGGAVVPHRHRASARCSAAGASCARWGPSSPGCSRWAASCAESRRGRHAVLRLAQRASRCRPRTPSPARIVGVGSARADVGRALGRRPPGGVGLGADHPGLGRSSPPSPTGSWRLLQCHESPGRSPGRVLPRSAWCCQLVLLPLCPPELRYVGGSWRSCSSCWPPRRGPTSARGTDVTDDAAVTGVAGCGLTVAYDGAPFHGVAEQAGAADRAWGRCARRWRRWCASRSSWSSPGAPMPACTAGVRWSAATSRPPWIPAALARRLNRLCGPSIVRALGRVGTRRLQRPLRRAVAPLPLRRAQPADARPAARPDDLARRRAARPGGDAPAAAIR